MVARLLWEQDVAGSNPVAPTTTSRDGVMETYESHKFVFWVRVPVPQPNTFQRSDYDLAMKTIFVNSLQANIFIDDIDAPEEDDRIKIYDSNKEYVDYFPIETLNAASEECNKTLECEYETRCRAIKNASDIYELIGIISTDEFIIAPTSAMRPIWNELLSSDAFTEKDIETALNWSVKEQIRHLRVFYDVNFIGKFALLNKDAR